MKPWDELRDTERREQIALRLGYTRQQEFLDWNDEFKREFPVGEMWVSPDRKMAYPPDSLPHWPTNDALAFTAVWPKICTIESAIYLQLRLGKPTVHRISNIDDLTDTVWTGTTWADAICQAACFLLGVPK